ncbi:hypothetical protein X777_08684, partial [Ooceraea biroi]
NGEGTEATSLGDFRACGERAEVPHESTALCCGIPRVGVRVRAVQSSQNPEKAPGFTRAAVGETPRNSRIRLSPNISSTRVVKDSRQYRVWLEGRWPGSFTLCAPANLRGNLIPPGNPVIWTRLTNLTGTREPQVTSSKTSDDLEDRYRT